jgi:hypothetical protein
MTFVLAIGDDKKWHGRSVNRSGADGINYDFLWYLDYEEVKSLIANGFAPRSPRSGVMPTGQKFNNKTGSQWTEVFIYDKKGYVYVLVSKNGNYKDYGFLDKYKLDEPPPDWKKVTKFQSLMWEYDREIDREIEEKKSQNTRKKQRS